MCLECQQHAARPTQFRAVFTTNTRVDAAAAMAVPTQRGGGGGRKRKGADGGGGADAAAGAPAEALEAMLPVLCDACGTQVGAMDADEVVHFFSVLASNA